MDTKKISAEILEFIQTEAENYGYSDTWEKSRFVVEKEALYKEFCDRRGFNKGLVDWTLSVLVAQRKLEDTKKDGFPGYSLVMSSSANEKDVSSIYRLKNCSKALLLSVLVFVKEGSDFEEEKRTLRTVFTMILDHPEAFFDQIFPDEDFGYFGKEKQDARHFCTQNYKIFKAYADDTRRNARAELCACLYSLVGKDEPRLAECMPYCKYKF